MTMAIQLASSGIAEAIVKQFLNVFSMALCS